jgi:hypothetical protein
MARFSLLTVAIAVLIGSAAAAEPDAVEKLDAKIQKNLERDQWHPASKTFVQALWNDFKRNYEENKQSRDGRGGSDVKSYGEYLGKYVRADGQQDRPLFEITKTEQGRFVIKIENHETPAVASERNLVFTTGDVVYSDLPRLSDKSYCTLEMYRLTRVKGEYLWSGIHERPTEGSKLKKLAE